TSESPWVPTIRHGSSLRALHQRPYGIWGKATRHLPAARFLRNASACGVALGKHSQGGEADSTRIFFGHFQIRDRNPLNAQTKADPITSTNAGGTNASVTGIPRLSHRTSRPYRLEATTLCHPTSSHKHQTDSFRPPREG